MLDGKYPDLAPLDHIDDGDGEIEDEDEVATGEGLAGADALVTA